MGTRIDVAEFLEHHGVKGQRWGIRNKRSIENSPRQKRASATRKRAGKKIALGVAGAALAAAGAIWIGKRYLAEGKAPISMKSIPHVPNVGGSKASQASRDAVNEIMRKHDETIRLFDADLRQRANAVGKHYVSDHVPWIPI